MIQLSKLKIIFFSALLLKYLDLPPPPPLFGGGGYNENISSRFFSTLGVASASLWVEPLLSYPILSCYPLHEGWGTQILGRLLPLVSRCKWTRVPCSLGQGDVVWRQQEEICTSLAAPETSWRRTRNVVGDFGD